MINIIYRFCNNTCSPRHDRPHWFSKLRCFESIYQNFSTSNKYRIYCIQDGDDGELTDFIKSKKHIYDFINIDFKSNDKSLDFCLKYAGTIKSGNYYFVEDDYLHRRNSNIILEEGLNKFNLITLYDHLDRYTAKDDITQNCESIDITNSCYWRTAESTTCTWACTRELWDIIKQDAINFNLQDRDFFRNLILKRIRLWTPIKSYSTHCMDHFLSPLIDWNKVSNSYCI
jgi:hypothetical protein